MQSLWLENQALSLREIPLPAKPDEAIRPPGTLVLKSTYRGDMIISWSPFVVDEITILGLRCWPFTPPLRLLESAQVDPTILIADQYPLADALEAMAAAQQPGRMKIILKP